MEDRSSEDFYDRDKLYKEVWEEPTTKVAKKYGVSDVALAKTCKKLHIPKPPPGYWAKKEFGKAPPPPKLSRFEDAPRIRVGRAQVKELDEPEIEYLAPEAFEEARILVERERSNSYEITVPDECSQWHPYVKNTRQYFKDLENRKWPYSQMYGRYGSHGEDTFRARISPESIDRMGFILQALCEAFEVRHFALVTKEGRDDSETFLGVEIMEEMILFELFESSVKEKKPDGDERYGDYIYRPTGILSIEICNPPWGMKSKKRWADTKRAPLEKRLNEVIVGLVMAAAWKKESAEHFRLKQLMWKKEEEKRAEKTRFREAEQKRN
jgi:hypothetical protein